MKFSSKINAFINDYVDALLSNKAAVFAGAGLSMACGYCDWYDSYSSSSQTDPEGPSTGSFRVDRGAVGTTMLGTAMFPIVAAILLALVATTSVCAFVYSNDNLIH